MATDASTTSGTGNLGFLMSRLGARVRREFAESLAPDGLKPPQYAVLTMLAAEGPLSQQRLAVALEMDRSDMVALVDELERRGAVERADDPVDRRRYAITLTRSGRTLLQRGDRLATSVTAAFFAPLTASERAYLTRVLVKLWSALSPSERKLTPAARQAGSVRRRRL